MTGRWTSHLAYVPTVDVTLCSLSLSVLEGDGECDTSISCHQISLKKSIALLNTVKQINESLNSEIVTETMALMEARTTGNK